MRSLTVRATTASRGLPTLLAEREINHLVGAENRDKRKLRAPTYLARARLIGPPETMRNT